MKFIHQSALLALSGAALCASTAMGAISIESGGLALAFYSTNPAESNTYVFDLGSGADFRENTAYNVPITTVNTALTSANIGIDLVTTFGADWYDSGDVRWMIVGTVKSTDPVTNGDPARTSYLSIGRSNLAFSTTISTFTSTGRGNLNTQATNFTEGVAGATQTVGINPAGSIINESQIKTVDEYVPPGAGTVTTYFGTGVDPQQTFGSGTIANSSVEGALDLYRILHSTSGADLTAGYSATDAVVGEGQYIGTLTINSAGALSVIPEPSSALLGVAGALGLCLRRRR
jgi:MYXO-CTERM domain-containing protein